MAIGHSQGAYATTDKSPNYLGEALGIGIDVAFKNRQLKTIEDDKLKAKQKANNDLFKLSEYKNTLGVNGNLNRMQYDLANNSRRKELELQQQYLNETDSNKRNQILFAKNNIESNFEQSKLLQEGLAKRRADLDLGKDVYDEQSLREKHEQMSNFALSDVNIDEVGIARFKTYDKNGKVTGENLNYEDVLNSYVPLKKSTFEADLNASVESVGVNTVENDRGIYTTKDIQADAESKKLSKAVFIKSQLDDVSNKSILARKLGVDPNNDVEIAKAMDLIYETKFDETHNKGINVGLLNSNRAEAENKVKAKKEQEEKEEKEVSVNDLRPNSKSPDGVVFGLGTKTIKKDLGGGNVETLKHFTLKSDGSIITTTMIAKPKLTPKQFADIEVSALKTLGINAKTFDEYNNLPNEIEIEYNSKNKNDDANYFFNKIKDVDKKSVKNTGVLRRILINNFREDFPSETNENVKNDSYTNITETDKGKIGVKNGKWYDIKTEKEIK